MSCLNSCNMIGRLVRNPELRHTESGVSVCNFTMAVDRTFPDKNGDYGVDFIDFTAWRKLAEMIFERYKKGDLIAVEGSLQVEQWTDKDGNPRSSAAIVVDNCRKLSSPSGRVPDAPSPAATPEFTEAPPDTEVPFDVT